MRNYQDTEIGKIPSDWEVDVLGNRAQVNRGASPRPIQDYLTDSPDGVNWIKIGDGEAGGKYIDSTKERIVREAVSSSRYVQQGDFLLSNSMSFGRPYILQIDGCIHDGWLVIQDYNKTLCKDYLYYVLSSDLVQKQYIEMAAGSGVQNLNKDKVQSVKIPIPLIKEQLLIAQALSDIDNLISTQEALIVKKQAIKQGAMQELLTGKRRLAGFVDKWCRHKLENIVDFCTSSVRLKDINVKEYIGTDNMLSNLGGVKDNELCLQYSTVREYKKKDILISNIRPYLQKAWFANRHGGCSNDVLVFRSKDERKYMPLFLYFLLTDGRFFDYATETATGSKMPRGDKEMIKVYELYLPDKIEEQQAIADTLDDMSADIANQQAKLEKLRRIKSGMMDKLLTGKIRLTD